MNQTPSDSQQEVTHVLLVDDDEHYLQATQSLLASEGYQVSAVSNARDALAILAQVPVDVALIDYSLPEVSGAELVHQVRANYGEVRIILQTGSTGHIPERDMLRGLDVHGLADKGDGPERLLLWTEVAAKAARAAPSPDPRSGLAPGTKPSSTGCIPPAETPSSTEASGRYRGKP